GLVEEREPRAPRGGVAAKPAPASAPDLAKLPKAALPARIEPQLATLATAAPPGEWVVETKFDGYRLMARVEGGEAKLITRNGHDWTAKMPALAAAVESLGVDGTWLDGEIVVMNAAGMPDFNALQNAIDNVAGEAIDYFV